MPVERLYRSDGRGSIRPVTVEDLVSDLRRRKPHYFHAPSEEEHMRPEIARVKDTLTFWKTENARLPEKIAKVMKDFEQGGKYYYAPRSEQVKANQRVVEDHGQQSAALLLDVMRAIDEADPLVRGDVASAMEAPSPIRAFLARHEKDGATASELLQVGILDELRQARFDRQLRGVHPGALLSAYEDAIATGEHDTAAYIERHGTALLARTDDSEALSVAHTLTRRIGEVRAARVPEALRQEEQILAEARAAVDRTQDLAHRPEMPVTV